MQNDVINPTAMEYSQNEFACWVELPSCPLTQKKQQKKRPHELYLQTCHEKMCNAASVVPVVQSRMSFCVPPKKEEPCIQVWK